MIAANDDSSKQMLDRIYAIAVDPQRLEELLDAWHDRLCAGGRNDGGEFFAQLQDPLFADHIERADQILQRLGDFGAVRPDNEAQELSRMPIAALLIDRNGRIVAVNQAASDVFGISAGSRFDKLPMDRTDRDLFKRQLDQAFGRLDRPLPLLRFRGQPGDRVLIMKIRKAGGDRALVMTSELEWPEAIGELLRDSFSLTAAEQATLRAVVSGQSASEIARDRRRSQATIRTQIQALLAKTGTRNQMELVRLTLGLMSIVRNGYSSNGDSHFYPQASTNIYHPLKLGDGRHYEYMLIGARSGRPFLWLPSDIGIARWTGVAETELGRRGITMVVPVRAGYGGSSAPPAERDIYEVAASDILTLLDHLQIEACPVITISDDFRIALELAHRAPERVVSVIGCGATMPATRPEHYWRMPKWHRFLRGNARYAPAVLPFIARACFGLARRIGKRAFMQKVLASAPADLAALEDDDLLADLVRGSEISVSDNFSAHEAFSREAIAFQTDWTPLLRTCPVAIMLFIGGQDPDTPFETVREYCEQFPHLRLIDYPNEGHFVTHTRWRDLLALIEEQLVQ